MTAMRARLAAPDSAERLLLGWPNGSVYDRDGSQAAIRRVINERLHWGSVAALPEPPDVRLLRGQSRLSCGGLNACSLRLDPKMRLSRLPRETVNR